MNQNFNFTATTKVYFGPGKLNMLGTMKLPGRKALLVISNGKSTKANGYLDRTIELLRKAGADSVVYAGIQANPTKESVEEGVRIAKDNGCDFVVGLGGGSVLDAAKVIAMNVTNEGDLWNYAMSGTGGRKPVSVKPLPWIAIPTTSGTGSDVDAGGVITNLKTKEKLGIFGSFADFAIVDPELTLSVPPRFTVYQGFDALFHCMEGQLCKSRNYFSNMIQEKAIRNVAQYLPVAYRDGSNLEARCHMALASTLSGYSMVASTCTVEHSIEHALSAYHEQLPHGAGLIMISKAYYQTIIGHHTSDEQFINMAQWLGKADAKEPQDFIVALEELKQKCDVCDLKMSDYGISPDEFSDMATNAMTVMERLSTQDIQPLTHDEIVTILRQSYKSK